MNRFKDRHFKNNLYIIIMCILMMIIITLSNMIMKEIPSKYTKIDLSNSDLYSLSKQTEDIGKQLKQNVDIYLISPRGKEDDKLEILLERYNELSSYINVEFVDPILNPEFVQDYTLDRLSDNSIIVSGAERFKVIRNSDIFISNYDYNTGKVSNDFDGEGQITSAIQFVTNGELTQCYFINGHGERNISENFQNSLEKEGIQVQPLNLKIIERIPEDAGCIFLYVPVSDITEHEANVILKYLDDGGRLLYISGISSASCPNLDKVLSTYGLSSLQGLIVEGEANYCIPSYSNFLLPEIKMSDITEPFINEDSLLLLPNSHAIGKIQDVRGSVEVNTILSTSSNSWLKTKSGNLNFESNDIVGPFSVGVTSEETIGSSKTRVVWLSSADIIESDIDEMVGGDNTDLILNSIAWLTERDNGVTIRPKTTESTKLRLTSRDAAVWSIVFVFVIPIIIIIIGVIISVKRRRQK